MHDAGMSLKSYFLNATSPETQISLRSKTDMMTMTGMEMHVVNCSYNYVIIKHFIYVETSHYSYTSGMHRKHIFNSLLYASPKSVVCRV